MRNKIEQIKIKHIWLEGLEFKEETENVEIDMYCPEISEEYWIYPWVMPRIEINYYWKFFICKGWDRKLTIENNKIKINNKMFKLKPWTSATIRHHIYSQDEPNRVFERIIFCK
jgi:hypothetical protein